MPGCCFGSCRLKTFHDGFASKRLWRELDPFGTLEASGFQFCRAPRSRVKRFGQQNAIPSCPAA